MKSVERLVAEHELIVRGLKLLEKAGGRIETVAEVLRLFVISEYANLGEAVFDQRIGPYWKTGGFVASFGMDHGAKSWNDCVVEATERAQRVGYQWIFTGDVRRDPSGWSNHPNVSWVGSIEWTLILPQPVNDPPECPPETCN
jgi:hypothetical protein